VRPVPGSGVARALFGPPDPRRKPAALPVAPPLVGECQGERGLVIATRVGGERALPQHGAWVLLTRARMVKHLLVLGATGAGRPRPFCG